MRRTGSGCPDPALAPYPSSEFPAGRPCPIHRGRFCALQSTASAVQGQRPRATRSKLNILFDHALGLFKILDHAEPNSHALLSSIVRLHCIFLHHTTAPHLPAPHPAPYHALHSPCTTWTSFCTTLALHHTRLHHIRPAPHAPHSPAPH